MSSAAPTSTTAELVKDVPLENSGGSSDLPGSFPETPATEPAAFSVNPIPASDGPGNPVKLAPGEPVPDPSTFTSNKISSAVHDDTSLVPEPTFSVNPIPATAGTGNPVSLRASEPVPDSSNFTANTVESTATTDKASYENSSSSAPVLPPVVTPQVERESNGTGVFDLPPVSKGLIPESSLPMGEAAVGSYDAGPTVQSAGPSTTTAQLAAVVPLEKKAEVPEVVKESQEQAGVEPEASAVPQEVQEKSAVEKELLLEVPEAPVTSDGTITESPVKAATGVTASEAAEAVGGAALAVGGAAAAYAATAKDKLVEAANGSPSAGGVTSYLPESVKQSIDSINAASSTKQSVAGNVPEEVKESIVGSGLSPEAAAYSELVAEKSQVEKELLSEIRQESSTGKSAPAADASVAPSTSEGLNAPATSEAVSASTESAVTSQETASATTKSQTEPAVTSGVDSVTTAERSAPITPSKPAATTPKASASPANSAAGSSAAADAKKKKRSSFFGKLKAKFSDKDKK